jgi:hypothetical protein
MKGVRMKIVLHAIIIILGSVAHADTWNLLPLELNSDVRLVDGFNEVKGITQNYKTKDKDGIVDFSLVIPAMTTQELVHFELSRVISPENDEIKIMSYSFEVPSNLSLPKQVESYFLSFTLEKPEFRAYIKEDGQYNLYGLHGQFPMKAVIDGYQKGQSIFEMVNLFTFKGGGEESVEVKGPVQDIKIAINEWAIDTSVDIVAPTFAKGKEMLAFSMFKAGDEFFPTDIKRVLSGKTGKMASRSGLDNYMLSVLVNNDQKMFINQLKAANGNIVNAIFGHNDYSRANYDFSQITYHLQKMTSTTANATFLPTIATPVFTAGQNTLTMTPPSATSGIYEYGTIVTLSEITAAGTASLPLDFKRQLWTTTNMGWVSSTVIPQEALDLIGTGKYALDVLFVGSETQMAADADFDWNQITHITRNAVAL